MTPVHKKCEKCAPQNYIPLCILSFLRKFIKAAIALRLVRTIPIQARQFGFQKGLSSLTTLIDVNPLVSNGFKRIATLDLTKVYARVNRTMLWSDYRNRIDANILNKFPACLQQLSISTKEDVTGTTAVQRLGLTEGAPLSPILFLEYIDDISQYCHRPAPSPVQEWNISGTEITLTADDVTLHTKNCL